jgi:hypothetical protein
MASTQPWITLPWAIGNGDGSPRSHDASNADVVRGGRLAFLDRRALADNDVLAHELARRLALGLRDHRLLGQVLGDREVDVAAGRLRRLGLGRGLGRLLLGLRFDGALVATGGGAEGQSEGREQRGQRAWDE